MTKEKMQLILELIAAANHTTPDQVRKEMQAAMEEGQRTSNPLAQAKWASIPRKGKELTLEEFIEYVATRLSKMNLS